jgi:hypothetical protein
MNDKNEGFFQQCKRTWLCLHHYKADGMSSNPKYVEFPSEWERKSNSDWKCVECTRKNELTNDAVELVTSPRPSVGHTN